MHPGTYATFIATLLLLMRDGDPIGEINRAFTDAKLLLVHLFCWFVLLIQMFVLERPFTVIIDTFLLPVLLCLLIWRLTPAQRRPLVWAIHATLLLNILIGYYEYFSGHRIIPLTLGSVLVVGEWRSAALLGHPLTASGIVGAYIMALVLRPAICPPIMIRVPLIAFSLGSLMAFGGRTALMTVLFVLACLGLLETIRLIRGKRVPLLFAVGAICFLFAAAGVVFAALLSRHLRQDAAALLVGQRQRPGALCDLRHAQSFPVERTDSRTQSGSRERAAVAARFELWHRELLGVLHRAIRPDPHHPDHARPDLLLHRTAAPVGPRSLRHLAADPDDCGKLGELLVEEHPAGATRSAHRAAVAARTRAGRGATPPCPSAAADGGSACPRRPPGSGVCMTIYVDHTHLGRHVTGLERITLELFSEQALAPLDVVPITSRGTGQMVATQTFGLPMRLASPSSFLLCPGFPPSPLLRMFSSRVLPYMHDDFLLTRQADLNARARLYMATPFKIALKNYPRFLTNSRDTQRKLAEHCRPDAEITLYRPPVRNVFKLESAERAEREPETSPLRVVALGTVEPRKNFIAAANIVRELRQHGFPGATLDIVGRKGWGDDWKTLERMSCVTLHGYQSSENVTRILNEADIFLCTSHDEGLGLATARSPICRPADRGAECARLP